MEIPLIKSTFYNEGKTKERLCRFIRSSKKLSMGAKCLEFESKFAKFQERQYCTLFSNGSAANLALFQSFLNLGWLKKGDKIAFSAVTWPTNVMPLFQLGFLPIPVDVELETLNVSSKTLSAALERHPDIRCFFLTNLLGFCSDPEEVKKICEAKKLFLVEDNCESLGTIYKGAKLGNFGFASTFSFYVGHHISTIEGGAICTDNKELFAMLNIVRAHGWDRNLPPSYQEKLRTENGFDPFYAQYVFYHLGYNMRPTEITGFLGIDQMEYVEDILKARNKNFLHFASALRENKDVYKLVFGTIDFVSNFAFPIVCKSEELLRKYVKRFQEAGVEIRPIVGGMIPLQPFYNQLDSTSYNLPNSLIIHKQGFYFGNNPEMTAKEIKTIEKLLI